MSIAYDNKGNVTGTVDGNGNTVTYSYDSNGMLSSISDDIGTIQNTVYREDGQPLSVRNASGTTFLYNYDAEGLCTSIQVQSPDGALLYTYTYTYDERHYLSSMTDTLGNVQTFETDASGNILAKTDALGNRTEYTYDIQSNLVKRKQKISDELKLVKQVEKVFNDSDKTYGYRAIQNALKNEGIVISEYKIRKIMRENGFYQETGKKYKPTHNGKTDGKYHKNLLQQNFVAIKCWKI